MITYAWMLIIPALLLGVLPVVLKLWLKNAPNVMILGVSVLASFMPLSALSFYRFRLPRKAEEFRRIVRILGVRRSFRSPPSRAVREEYSGPDYLLPVAFATFVCILGSIVLLLGSHLNIAEEPSFLLSGVYFMRSKTDCVFLRQIQCQSLQVMSLAFMGSYLWSAQSVVRRVITIDLGPGAYYHVAIRMILAAFVALMFSFVVAPITTAGDLAGTGPWSKNNILVIAFIIGVFPERALRHLSDLVWRRIVAARSPESDELPLSMIEGMSTFHRLRLTEIGIDNAQNLAESDLIELLLRTPFNGLELIDWIAQAKLYTYFKSDLDILRELGIRTIFDFREASADETNLSTIVQDAEKKAEGRSRKLATISDTSLRIVRQRVNEDKSIDQLLQFRRNLSTLVAEKGTVEPTD